MGWIEVSDMPLVYNRWTVCAAARQIVAGVERGDNDAVVAQGLRIVVWRLGKRGMFAALDADDLEVARFCGEFKLIGRKRLRAGVDAHVHGREAHGPVRSNRIMGCLMSGCQGGDPERDKGDGADVRTGKLGLRVAVRSL